MWVPMGGLRTASLLLILLRLLRSLLQGANYKPQGVSKFLKSQLDYLSAQLRLTLFLLSYKLLDLQIMHISAISHGPTVRRLLLCQQLMCRMTWWCIGSRLRRVVTSSGPLVTAPSSASNLLVRWKLLRRRGLVKSNWCWLVELIGLMIRLSNFDYGGLILDLEYCEKNKQNDYGRCDRETADQGPLMYSGCSAQVTEMFQMNLL